MAHGFQNQLICYRIGLLIFPDRIQFRIFRDRTQPTRIVGVAIDVHALFPRKHFVI